LLEHIKRLLIFLRKQVRYKPEVTVATDYRCVNNAWNEFRWNV